MSRMASTGGPIRVTSSRVQCFLPVQQQRIDGSRTPIGTIHAIALLGRLLCCAPPSPKLRQCKSYQGSFAPPPSPERAHLCSHAGYGNSGLRNMSLSGAEDFVVRTHTPCMKTVQAAQALQETKPTNSPNPPSMSNSIHHYDIQVYESLCECVRVLALVASWYLERMQEIIEIER